MKTSHKFATSPDVLVAKGKNSVANVTVLVAISSPVKCHSLRSQWVKGMFLVFQ